MLQAIEAEISPDGRVTLLEPVHLSQSARAVVTILAPIGPDAAPLGSAAALLGVLDSADLDVVAPGDPQCMEREIAANRDAWGD